MPPAAIHLPDPPKLFIIFKLAASALDLLLPPRCCRCCAKGGKPSSIQADWSRGNRIYRKWGQIRAVVSPRSLGYIAQMRYMLRFSGISVSEVRKDVLCFPSNRLAPRGHRRSALAPRRQPILAPLTTSLLMRYRGSSCSLSRCHKPEAWQSRTFQSVDRRIEFATQAFDAVAGKGNRLKPSEKPCRRRPM